MSEQRPLFVDTSFWVGLLNEVDQHRFRVMEWNHYLTRHGVRLVTTEAVLWEWMNFASAVPVRTRAIDAYKRVHGDSNILVISFGTHHVSAAVNLFATRADKSWSLTDCLSFVVMKELALSQALTADHHFEQAGFTALLLQSPPSLP